MFLIVSLVYSPLFLFYCLSLLFVFPHGSWTLPSHVSFLSIISSSPPRALAFLPSALVSWKQFLHVFLIRFAFCVCVWERRKSAICFSCLIPPPCPPLHYPSIFPFFPHISFYIFLLLFFDKGNKIGLID